MATGSRFRQINLLFVVLLSLFLVSDVVTSFRSFSTLLTDVSEDFFLYLSFCPLFVVLLFQKEQPASRLFQVTVMVTFAATVIVLITPREFGGDLAYLLAGALAYKYGFFDRLRRVKAGAFALLFVAIRLVAAYLNPGVSIARSINQIGTTLIAAPVLYWIFEIDYLRMRNEKHRLEVLSTRNQPFVEFGRNVTGIVHDFKNDLGLFHTFGQYLSILEGEPLDQDQVRRYRGYVDRLGSRINQIMTVTQGSQRYGEEVGELQTLMRSVMYVFQSNLDFKRVIDFQVEMPPQAIYGYYPPAVLISILENLIRNSCEALVESVEAGKIQPGRARLTVTLALQEREPIIVVRDEGPGIPFCDSCGVANCLDCPKFIEGHTTKINGSGVGMVTVRRLSRQYGIAVHMRSYRGHGVSSRIVVKRAPVDHPLSPSRELIGQTGR